MSLFDVLILPALLGLLGFLEPCSLAINSIFLTYLNKLDSIKKIFHTLIFAFVRALVIGILGISIAFIGKKLFVFQSYYFVLLGIFYIILGIYYLYSKHKGITLFKLNLNKFSKKSPLIMGVVFGLVIPACAIPLLLLLLGKNLVLGEFFNGFISMFIFGLGLSLPLVFISISNKASNIIKAISEKSQKIPYIIGILIIILGILTALSSYWWI